MVPAFSYSAASAALMAALPIFLRRSAFRKGEGDSSVSFDRIALGFDGSIGAGDNGHTGFPDGVLRDRFVAHHFDGFRLWTDKLDVTGLALLGKLRVFREKTVARMYRVDIGDFGGAND